MKQTFLIFSAVAITFLFGCNSEQTTNESETQANETVVEDVKEEAVDEHASDGTTVYQADIERSVIGWKGAKKVGKKHTGFIKLQSGSLTITNGVLTSVEFVADMTSISNEDMAGSEYATKLEGHLKSADFFDAEGFPTASFKSIDVFVQEEGQYKISGDLIIKGISNMVVVKADVGADESNLSAQANLVIDRAKWDVQYGSESFFDLVKDEIIANEIELDIRILAATE